jgi:phage virion morphogenesis protein
MTGVTHQIDATQAVKAFDQLGMLDMYAVADAIGEMIVGQTKERIATEKTAPDGAAWAPWSVAYDNTRNHSKHSLLVGEGSPGLMESIANYTRGSTIEVGTNLIYGKIHQFGGEPGKDGADVPSGAVGSGIPARPYLGLSGRNEAEIEELVADVIAGYLQ